MSSEQDNTAVIAIVIAAIAFIVTVGQLVQQLFGTAEGYRHCQDSVIGEWATKTQRRWRWSEFRLETRFMTPDIFLHDTAYDEIWRRDSLCTSQADDEEDVHVDITGAELSRRKSHMWLKPTKRSANSDLVRWHAFLSRLHTLGQAYYSPVLGKSPIMYSREKRPATSSQQVAWPAITHHERSWDFMPPDITRPFATSTVGDVIALGQRLGLVWDDLRPSDGIMRAEGNGQTITSTTVRGLGLLLQYDYDEAYSKVKSLLIPSNDADKLGFGIIPGCQSLSHPNGLPDISFDGLEGKETNIETNSIKGALQQLGLSVETMEDYLRWLGANDRRLYGFSDLLGMWSPFLPLWDLSVVEVMVVHRDIHDTPTLVYEGFKVFQIRLQKENRSKQMEWVLQNFNEMEQRYERIWMDEVHNKEIKNGRDIKFLNDLHAKWDYTTDYFQSLERSENRTFHYRDLVGAHMSQALRYPAEQRMSSTNQDTQSGWVHCPDPAWSRVGFGPGILRGEGHDHTSKEERERIAWAMNFYISSIPRMVEYMEEKHFDDKNVVRDAWWTLIFRAMCWNRSVAWHDEAWGHGGLTVPSKLYGSKVPVYLA